MMLLFHYLKRQNHGRTTVCPIIAGVITAGCCTVTILGVVWVVSYYWTHHQTLGDEDRSDNIDNSSAVVVTVSITTVDQKEDKDVDPNNFNKERKHSTTKSVDSNSSSTTSHNKDDLQYGLLLSSLQQQRLPSHLQHQLHKDQRRRSKLPWLTRKSPLYDNIQMFDPNNVLLCNISNKKAHWYVRKGLAMWKQQQDGADPNTLAIQLLFTPKNSGGDNVVVTEQESVGIHVHRNDQDSNQNNNNSSYNVSLSSNRRKKNLYTTSIKQNICVVCGASQHLIRHYVVPMCYRKLFPHDFKSHQPHDIVLLCADCQMIITPIYQDRMQELDQQHRRYHHVQHKINHHHHHDTKHDDCNGDDDDDDNKDTTAVSHFVDPYLTKVQSCALALLRYQHCMPEERIQEYEQFLWQHIHSPEHVQPCNNNNDSSRSSSFHVEYTEDDVTTSDAQVDTLAQDDTSAATATIEPTKRLIILTHDQLLTLSRMDVQVANEKYIPGPNLVVEALLRPHDGHDEQQQLQQPEQQQPSKIQEFIIDWRRFFVGQMQPQFLPMGWRIDSPVTCDNRRNETSHESDASS